MPSVETLRIIGDIELLSPQQLAKLDLGDLQRRRKLVAEALSTSKHFLSPVSLLEFNRVIAAGDVISQLEARSNTPNLSLALILREYLHQIDACIAKKQTEEKLTVVRPEAVSSLLTNELVALRTKLAMFSLRVAMITAECSSSSDIIDAICKDVARRIPESPTAEDMTLAELPQVTDTKLPPIDHKVVQLHQEAQQVWVAIVGFMLMVGGFLNSNTIDVNGYEYFYDAVNNLLNHLPNVTEDTGLFAT